MSRIKITKQVNQGDSVGVSASGINGYTFKNWTENGSVVSSSNPYNFTAQSSRLINATFNAPVVIVASSSDSDYGSVSGSGTYSYGSTVNVSATANSGYEFSGWTESGSVVSNNPSYSFTATSDRNLVATFNSVITVRTTGADTIYLYNNSNQTYTWNLSSGTNTYDGSVSGFELDNLKYVYKFTNSSGSDNLITYVDISKTSIEDISNYAFCSCSALTTFIFPDTLTTIGSGAFTNSGLTTFTIPSSVKFVNNNSFYQSTWWNNYAGGTIYYKDNVCLGCDTSGTRPTGSVSITSGTRVIATDAFTICTGITSMSLPNSLKVINNSAFYYCSGLHSLTIPTSVEYIGVGILDNSGIYSDAADHTTLVVSNCVVGHKGSITGDVELPNTTRLLSAQSFAFQTGITSFTINRATPPIYCPNALDTANNPGDGSCTSPIYVPAANVNTYKAADGWTAVASRIQGFTTNTISASVSPSGSGTISGTGTYRSGATCTLVCTPATGYAFSEWTESGSTVSSTASYTFTVSGNRTLVAACQSTVPMHTITVLKGQNAELSPESMDPTFSGGGTYPEGTTITISMTSPSTQYTVAQWYNQTETVQGNYDTWTKYSLNGHYVDSNSISYTVGDHDETIYCNVFIAGGNYIYSRHFETYDDPMMTASIPAFDCYDSNNNLLGTWSGQMDQAVECPFTASSVYKLVNHVEYIEPEWDPGNPMPVYSNLVYLDSADFSGLINLHEIDGYGGSGGGSMYIGDTMFILPPSCTVVKNMHFGAAQLYDESTQQLMLYYPRHINFGNVETVEGVEFVSYDIENSNTIVQEMTLWDGEGNYGIRQWAVSTYKLSSMTDFSISQCYQPELYFPNLPSGSSIGAQGLPALTGDTVYMTPNITKISLQDCSSITSITIPAHIEEIGNMRCSNLASITFEGGFNSHLKYINQYAFQNCTSLTSINIPYMVAKLSNNYPTPNIGYNAFSGCTGLTTATIGARAVDNYIFQNCTSLTSVSLPYLSTIKNISGSLVGQGIFFGCSSLRTVRLGSKYSAYVQGVSAGWLGMATGSTSTNFWKYNNNSAYPSTITAIYYDYEDGPSSSLFINSGIPNSKFVLHIGEDAMDDGTDWDNIGNLKTDPDRLQQDL